jgi:hypothetical protein
MVRQSGRIEIKSVLPSCTMMIAHQKCPIVRAHRRVDQRCNPSHVGASSLHFGSAREIGRAASFASRRMRPKPPAGGFGRTYFFAASLPDASP